MEVDHARAWLALKAYLLSKNAHGQRDLLAHMARIEVESSVAEGEEGFDPSPLRRNGRNRGYPAHAMPREAGRDG